MDGYFHFELETVAAAHISIYDRSRKEELIGRKERCEKSHQIELRLKIRKIL